MSEKKEEGTVETLKTENGEYQTTFTKKYRERKPWKRPDVREIYSIIPGTITEVMVKVGDKVEKGDTLLTFNAMKMNNTLKSPLSGKIGKVNVKPGEPIAKGVLLVVFE